MSVEFVFRIVGMLIFAFLGARFGVSTADVVNLPADANGLIFSSVGALMGLIATPWITVRPAKSFRRFLLQSKTEVLVTSMVGLLVGLIGAALIAWPLSLLPNALGEYLPVIVSLAGAYFGIILFSARAHDIFTLFGAMLRGNFAQTMGETSDKTGILVDTSVIIDGRILEISKSGFIQGTIVVPQFVLSELHSIANSSDPVRRQRGRHGLEILNKLKEEGLNSVQVIDDNPKNVEAVDNKLVEVAKIRSLPLMTNDFNLNGVAGVHGVRVLNLNDLSLALQPNILPGENLTLQIVSEGREPDQGVGYLKDGTMVVVEGGRRYLDRTIPITITRYIRSSAGKMYFSIPEMDARP